MSEHANVVSYALNRRRINPDRPETGQVSITLLYGRVIAIKVKNLWRDGGAVPAVLAGLSELYSPSFDRFVCRPGMVLPITNPKSHLADRIRRGAVLRFSSAIRNILSSRPRLVMVSKITLIRGHELAIYQEVIEDAQNVNGRLPDLSWETPFLFEDQVKQMLDYEAAVQRQQRERESAAVAREKVGEFTLVGDEIELTTDVVRPGKDRASFVASRPRLSKRVVSGDEEEDD